MKTAGKEALLNTCAFLYPVPRHLSSDTPCNYKRRENVFWLFPSSLCTRTHTCTEWGLLRDYNCNPNPVFSTNVKICQEQNDTKTESCVWTLDANAPQTAGERRHWQPSPTRREQSRDCSLNSTWTGTLFQWMKKPQDFPGASAERREVLGGRVAAAPSATHVDVCNERVRVDKGKHFMGPHDAAQTASSQAQCFRSVRWSRDAVWHVDSLWPVAAAAAPEQNR